MVSAPDVGWEVSSALLLTNCWLSGLLCFHFRRAVRPVSLWWCHDCLVNTFFSSGGVACRGGRGPRQSLMACVVGASLL